MHQTTRNYLVPISFGTIISLAGFISVLYFIDPLTSGYIGHLFFFLTLFLSIYGVMTTLGIITRKRFAPGMFSEQLRNSSRQAILIAILVLSFVILQLFNLLFWWIALTVILFIIVLEIFITA